MVFEMKSIISQGFENRIGLIFGLLNNTLEIGVSDKVFIKLFEYSGDSFFFREKIYGI